MSVFSDEEKQRLRLICGYISGDLGPLHHVSVPRIWESFERAIAAIEAVNVTVPNLFDEDTHS